MKRLVTHGARAPEGRAGLVILALVAAAVPMSGCLYTRAAGRAASSLFESPRKVSKKETTATDPSARLSMIWVGHATAIVQMDDKVILTDPVFTSTVGQLSKRLVEPGFEAENLPPVDAVVVSHLHFDHFSLGSLSKIESKVRTLFLPPGGVTYLTDFGFPVVELRPWQAWEKDGLRVTAVPVDHVGWRYGIDDAWMTESFTGYVFEYHGLSVYFGGDTAYDQKNFVEAGQRFPSLDLALLPIGPIEPHSFMRRLHMDPPEAVQAFLDLGARRMVPIHYDTFVNSTDNPGDALRALEAAKKSWSLGDREILPVEIGPRRVFVEKPLAIEMTLDGVLVAGDARNASELARMPAAEKRRAVMAFVKKHTGAPAPGHFDALDDDALVGKAAVIAFLLRTRIRTVAELDRMSDDDQRNTLITENAGHTQRSVTALQGMDNRELVRLGLGWFSPGPSPKKPPPPKPAAKPAPPPASTIPDDDRLD